MAKNYVKGDVLSNGAIIDTIIETTEGTKVLCKYHHTVGDYVGWTINHSDGSAYWGHYYAHRDSGIKWLNTFTLV